mgnify:CR=1 FL=1
MDKLTDSIVDTSSLESPEFTEYKKTLPQEPEGDVKKIYSIACHTPRDWTSIHRELVKDGSSDVHVPTEVVSCIDDKKHSTTRGSYKLTETEAAELAKDSRVKCVNIDVSSYPGTYAIDPLQIMDAIVQIPRYSSDVKNLRGYSPPSSPTAADLNRCGYQLLRSKQKTNAWGGSVPGVENDSLASYGDGSHVDIIVGDQACWFGHIEFQNNLGGPTNYTGGNVLPGNGTCDLLDVILDGPYYIDPMWFNNDPATLMTRWDGTIVPQEQSARAWWTDSNKRSAVYANIGTVPIPSYYTRDRSNGSNTANHSSGGGDYHGTPCASQAYGRQYGFAYNANKWYINAYGQYGCGFENYFDVMKLFHLHKPTNPIYGTKDPTISSNSWGYRKPLPNTGYYFHRKGLTGTISTGYSISVTASGASSYTLSGTDKGGSVSGNNPTISCNTGDIVTFSVNANGHPFYIKTQAGTGTGNQAPGVVNQGATNGDVVFTPQSDGTYYYQCELHGSMVGTINVTTGVSAGVQWNSGTMPAFLSNFTQDAIRFEYIDNVMSIAGDELIDSGVIFICSSGNTNQKLVKADHPDYDNYWGVSANTGFPNAYVVYGGYAAYNTINRNGFPGQIGKQGSGSSTVYRTISVGALSDFLYSTSGSGVEKKVNYSNMGNLIPYYAPAANSISAGDDSTSSQYNRFDTYYSINNVQSHPSYDILFGGTSSACPVSAGLIATKVQYNRDWDYADILNWVTTSVGTQAAGDMVVGNDSSTPNAVGTGEWNDVTSLQGGQPIILWDAPTGNEPGAEDTKVKLNITNASGLNISGVNIINT